MIYGALAKWSIKGKQIPRKNGPKSLQNRENDSQSQQPTLKSVGIQHQREKSQTAITKNKGRRGKRPSKNKIKTDCTHRQ